MEQLDRNWGWVTQADWLLQEIEVLLRRRVGRLVAVTVAVPQGLPHDRILDFVADRLAARGHEAVELQLIPRDGALRVLAAEFES